MKLNTRRQVRLRGCLDISCNRGRNTLSRAPRLHPTLHTPGRGDFNDVS